eukprot:COSAG06_NODE_3250_length_5615_cov_15.071972_3_plen_672_part_00
MRFLAGHYYWDNDNPAIITCRALGYETGSLYTYGTDASLDVLPVVTGYRKCHPPNQDLPEDSATNPLPPSILECESHPGEWHANGHNGDDGTPASPTDFDCEHCTASGDVNTEHNLNSIDSPPAGSGRTSDCTHAIDQGAMCYNPGTQGQTKCHTHTGAGQNGAECDDWHGCDGGCIKCSGCSFGCSSTDTEHQQDLIFGCVQFATTQCTYDVTHMEEPSFAAALRIFIECSLVDPQPEGYCMGSLASAAYLSNQDVCQGPGGAETGASNSNIGFHVRIPFRCNVPGSYNFRYHADFGSGAFIGVDGAEHTPGNTWGHLTLSNQALTLGDHEFEALGFEDCCDGHSELEVHLPGDHCHSVWRVVVSGETQCLQQTGLTGAVLGAACGPPADVGGSAAQCEDDCDWIDRRYGGGCDLIAANGWESYCSELADASGVTASQACSVTCGTDRTHCAEYDNCWDQQDTCQNGGTCVDGIGSYTCDCLPEVGFYGYACELPLPPLPDGYDYTYDVVGCSNPAHCGTFVVVQARCTSGNYYCPGGDYARPGWTDATRCDGVPTYQSGGPGGPVLYRYYNSYSDHGTQWRVGSSDVLNDCIGSGADLRSDLNPGRPGGAPDGSRVQRRGRVVRRRQRCARHHHRHRGRRQRYRRRRRALSRKVGWERARPAGGGACAQ